MFGLRKNITKLLTHFLHKAKFWNEEFKIIRSLQCFEACLKERFNLLTKIKKTNISYLFIQNKS